MPLLTPHDAFRVERQCPGLYPIQVVDPFGWPHKELTVYANKASEYLSKRTIPVYLSEIVRAFTWVHRDTILRQRGFSLLDDPDTVRRVVTDYLTSDCNCILRHRRDSEKILNIFVRKSDKTRVNVRITLTALKHLYHVLRINGLYNHDNPLVSEVLVRKLRDEVDRFQRSFLSEQGRQSPIQSGGVDDDWSHRLRYSSNYFQLVDGEWRPQVISNPNLPMLVYKAGEQYGWKLRERIIARLLFETGGRISEVINRTLDDWLEFDCLGEMKSHSKGSNGSRVKILSFTTETANLLRRYFDTERAEADSGSCKTLADFRKAVYSGGVDVRNVPVFLSRSTRKAYSVAAFRDIYWRPALRAAKIQCQIHQARHWFVTRSIQLIDEESKDDTERRRKRAALIKYMSWRSGGSMLSIYDHSDRNVLAHIHEIHKRMEEDENSLRSSSLDLLRDKVLRSLQDREGCSQCPGDDDLSLILHLGSMEDGG